MSSEFGTLARHAKNPFDFQRRGVAIVLPRPRSVILYEWPDPDQRQPRSRRRPTSGPVGAYAGRARFQPACPDRLPSALRGVIGRVAEFGYAGIAGSSEPVAGQQLYLEWCCDDVFNGYFIPEQDLHFLEDSPDPNG